MGMGMGIGIGMGDGKVVAGPTHQVTESVR